MQLLGYRIHSRSVKAGADKKQGLRPARSASPECPKRARGPFRMESTGGTEVTLTPPFRIPVLPSSISRNADVGVLVTSNVDAARSRWLLGTGDFTSAQKRIHSKTEHQDGQHNGQREFDEVDRIPVPTALAPAQQLPR